MFLRKASQPRPLRTPVPEEKSDARPRTQFVNFGGNQVWKARCYRPQTESDILDILNSHRHERVRPVGSLYSWSGAPVGRDVTVDMSCFDSFQILQVDGEVRVRLGGGLSVQQALETLHAQTERTFPVLGAVTKQSIAGVVSTATHGSGKPSLSHYVQAVRVAAFDPDSGKAKVFEHREGEELRAARCAVGTMGIILSVELETVPKYLIEETVVGRPTLDSVLELYEEYPLSQFGLAPYRWDFLVFQRREIVLRALTGREKLVGRLTSWMNFIGVDVVFHLLLKLAVSLGPKAVRSLMKISPELVLKDKPNIGPSTELLTLSHDLFCHEEMEIFIPSEGLETAVELIRYVTGVFAAQKVETSSMLVNQLRTFELYDELQTLRGRYTHHYPFFFRKVLNEDDMIGMGSGASPYFSCSVFTYLGPNERDDYEKFCSWLARALHRLVDARLHWGKHFPLTHSEMERVYPELPMFRKIVKRTDPKGVFKNDFVAGVLGL